MKEKTKERMRLAILNAAEMIRGHVEIGLFPEDINENDEEGLKEYGKACIRVSRILDKLSNRYKC